MVTAVKKLTDHRGQGLSHCYKQYNSPSSEGFILIHAYIQVDSKISHFAWTSSLAPVEDLGNYFD
jgi:hypothetical protein